MIEHSTKYTEHRMDYYSVFLAMIRKFTEIIAWKKAHEIVIQVYKLTNHFPREELYVLVAQIRRCAISIPSNIAEGFKRRSKNEQIRFYNIAQSSLEELKYQILLSKDLGYLNDSEYQTTEYSLDELGRILYKWTYF